MQSKKKKIFYIVALFIVVLVVFFLYSYRQKVGRIFSPILMAIVVAYIIQPIVIRLEKRKIPRNMAIILIYLCFFVIIAMAVLFLVPELINNTKELSNTLPDITVRYEGIFNDIMSVIQSSKWPPEIKNAIFTEVQNGINIAQNYLADALKKVLLTFIQTVTIVFDLVLSMFIAYYLIKDGKRFSDVAISVTPKKMRDGILKTGRDINHIMANFIQGQLLDALIIGILEAIGLFIAGVKYPIVLGMTGGLANIIPYFGPIIGAVPAVAVALIESPIRAVWAVLVFVIVQQIDNALISSKIIEGRLGIHPLTTIIVVLIGGEFLGVIGMLIAVPVAAIIRVVIKRVVEAIV